ncbi:MAG: RIP metalloprotease RseP [bacterium]|jgi:regulator of sigma E protease
MYLEGLYSTLFNIIHFGIVLGLAVIFHEWGHFIVAKLLGAKVDRFAVGFGKTLASYKWHETEYALCALPLGGYVKIRGMDPDDETTGAEWEFLQLSPWKRILIVLAGPAMNFVLAFLLYAIILLSFGQPYHATNTVGYIPVGSIGWEMGLQDGDQIVAINGQEVDSWEAVLRNEHNYDSEAGILTVTINRNGEIIEKSKPLPNLLLIPSEELPQYEAPETYEGIYVSMVEPQGAAARAGLEPNVVIQKLDGQKFTSREEWSNYISTRYTQDENGNYQSIPIEVEYTNSIGDIKTITITPDIVLPAEDAQPYQPKAQLDISYQGEISVKEYLTPVTSILGVAPKLPPVIGNVQEGSPAYEGGITPGSRIVEINGEPIDDWVKVLLTIQDSLQREEEQITAAPLEVTWLTADQEMKTGTITPMVTHMPIYTPSSIKTGKTYALAQIGVDMHTDRKQIGVLGALVGAWHELINITVKMVVFIAQLFTGEVSAKLLGGPIAIYQLSGEAGRWGLEKFLTFIALLSANLGLINLFPMPPLDGGHIVFYTYEMIRRKPLSMKQMENFARIGFALIIPLFLYLIINDLSRLDLFQWIKGIFS